MEQTKNSFLHELTLRDYIRMIFRHWPIVVTAVLVIMTTVYVALSMRTPLYEAQVRMLITSEKETQAPYSRDAMGYDRAQLNLTQSEIVKSAPVLERVIKVSGLNNRPLDYEKKFASKLRKFFLEKQVSSQMERLQALPSAQRDYIIFRRTVANLRANINVNPLRNTSIFVISVRDFDPMSAAALANLVSRSYTIFDLEQQLAEITIKYGEKHPTVSLLQAQIDRMVNNLSGAPLENIDAIGPATVKIIEQAAIPMQSDKRSKKVMVALAGIIGIFFGLILAFIFEYLDQSVRSSSDLAKVLEVPIMGRIPQQHQSHVMIKGDEAKTLPKMVAYHELACQVRYLFNQKKTQVFLITAPDVDEGTTTIVSNLGLCLAKDFKKKTLIIDAHHHNPGIHRVFENGVGPGLTEVLSGQCSLSQAVKEINPNLWVLTAGETSGDSMELLDSSRMSEILLEAKNVFEVVLIDCADLRNYRDAVSLGNYVDGIIVVVSEGKTRRQAVAAAVSALKENNFNIVGTVFNNRTFVLPKFIYDRV